MRSAGQSLVDYVGKLPTLDDATGQFSFQSFAMALMRVFEKNIKNDRVSNPLMEALDNLLSGGVFQTDEAEVIPIAQKLHALVKREVFKSKDPKKLGLALKVYVFIHWSLIEALGRRAWRVH